MSDRTSFVPDSKGAPPGYKSRSLPLGYPALKGFFDGQNNSAVLRKSYNHELIIRAVSLKCKFFFETMLLIFKYYSIIMGPEMSVKVQMFGK
jgi:hypothetical protein